MSAADEAGRPTRAARAVRERLRRYPRGLFVFTLVWAVGVGAILWGIFVARPEIPVREFDAGPVDERFAIGRVVPFPEVDVYVIGLEDGRLRALDAIVRGSGCSVTWLPGDERGRARNPLGTAGVFHDACSDGLWAATGDALVGDQPLRSFKLFPVASEADGRDHLVIEVIGPRSGRSP